MAAVELILLLLAVSAMLRILAQRIALPYPVLLVLGGLALSLMPGLPRVTLPPGVLFLVFIPPLLYAGAWAFPLRDFRRELGAIVRLAVLMVLVSMTAVAVVAHALNPAFTWPAAFVLGAIVSPPDPVSVLSLMRSMRAPRQIETILEGEGLFNDATALVAYRMAVAAVVSGTFSPSHALVQFLLSAAGGVAIGVALGIVAVRAYRFARPVPVAENTLTLLTPFAAYLLAEPLGASGVLSVVAAAMYVSRALSRDRTAATRMQIEASWTFTTFLLESLVFILVGLELPNVTRALYSHSLAALFRDAALISLCVVLVRIVWILPSAYLARTLGRWLRGGREALPSWRWVLFIAWTGMRGGDSLVIALALPLRTASGTPFPARDEIVFITFCVIFVTLVLQGSTIAPLARLLGLRGGGDGREGEEEAHARLTAIEAGLATLKDPAVAQAHPEVVRYLRQRHGQRARRWAARERHQLAGRPHDFAHEHTVGAPSHEAGAVDEDRADEYRKIRADMIRAEQRALVGLRDRGEIGDDVMRRIQRELDLESVLLDSRDPVLGSSSEVAALERPEARPRDVDHQGEN